MPIKIVNSLEMYNLSMNNYILQNKLNKIFNNYSEFNHYNLHPRLHQNDNPDIYF